MFRVVCVDGWLMGLCKYILQGKSSVPFLDRQASLRWAAIAQGDLVRDQHSKNQKQIQKIFLKSIVSL